MNAWFIEKQLFMLHHTENPAERAADIAVHVAKEAKKKGQILNDTARSEIYFQALAEFIHPDEFLLVQAPSS